MDSCSKSERDGHKWPLPGFCSDGGKFGLLVRSPVPTSLVARMNLLHVADAIPSASAPSPPPPFFRALPSRQVFQSYLASHRGSERARGPTSLMMSSQIIFSRMTWQESLGARFLL